MNVAGLVEQVCAADPQRRALVLAEGEVTYGELGAAVRSATAALSAAGIRPGGRVTLVDECSSLFLATVLGAMTLGAAAAPMNHRLTPDEIAALHETAGCTLAVAGTPFAAAVEEALGRPPLVETDVLAPAGDGGAPAGTDEPPETATALVLFTSGTTGLPKAVPLRHAELTPRVRMYAGRFDPATPPAVTLTCVPVVHVGGLVGLLVALAGGNTVVVERRFEAGEWLTLVERHGVQRAFLVPAMLRRVLDHPRFATTDLSSLQALSYGAAPATSDLIARAVAAFPHVAFSNVFGQTETLGAVTALGPADHRDPRRIGSVGRPLPGVEIRVVDPSTGEDVAEGDVGEFWVFHADEWQRTGDLVRQDADGYLYAEGRLSDTINRGGEKVGPAEVEAVLRRHPAVVDAAVAGYPDDELGQRVGAALVLSDPDAAAPDLGAFCREHLAPFKVPERVAVVGEIPLTDMGKVDRHALTALLSAPPGPEPSGRDRQGEPGIS